MTHIPDGVVEIRVDCGKVNPQDETQYVRLSHDGCDIFIRSDDDTEIMLCPIGARRLGETLVAFANMMERGT